MQLTTQRLTIRELTIDDAAFIKALLNTPGFKQNIADRGIDTIEKAEKEITHRYSSGYPTFGFFAVCLKSTSQPVGGVTLINRDQLDVPDLGYAFLPEFSGQGYALESTIGLRDWAIENGFPTLCAIVQEENVKSIALLQRLDFAPKGTKDLTDPEETLLYFEYTAETKNKGLTNAK
ncbi:GNAT family N-acetyltransferase [Psychrosphaera sp.]|nr:GNAT family N-acetyltransferase [Psychrosphaera sp.]